MRQPALLLAFVATAAAWTKRSGSGSEESWSPARETSFPEMHEEQVAMGWSPRPTEAPKALMGRMLMPRMDGYTLGPATCGFVASDGISFTCITGGATCTYSSSHVGCCEPNKDCNIIKTTCIDYDASSAGACNLPDDFHTLCCSVPSRGACYTWVVSTTGKDDEPDETFTLLDCASETGTATLLDYDPSWAKTHVFQSTSSTSRSKSASSATQTSASESGAAGDDNGGSNDDNNADDDSKSKKGGTNVGAIAGGAAGGAVALAIIGAVIFFCLRRKKNAAAKTAGDASPPQPMVQNPQSPPASTLQPSSPGAYSSGVPPSFQSYPQPGQPGYDPHASIYSQPGYNQQYPPQQFQGYYNPQQPGFPPGQHPHMVPVGYHPSSTASPPPLTTPSPGVPQSTPSPGAKDGAEVQTTVNELQAVNPIGHESNRAELGPQ